MKLCNFSLLKQYTPLVRKFCLLIEQNNIEVNLKCITSYVVIRILGIRIPTNRNGFQPLGTEVTSEHWVYTRYFLPGHYTIG